MRFYDREKELTLLENSEIRSRETASLLVMMGRRRIGKTALIIKSLEKKEHAYLFVSRDSEALLCQKFQAELTDSLGLSIYGTVTKFRDLFEIIMKESLTRHFTVVLDEVQNLYRINPATFSEMQDIWDRYHAKSRINLICCGSIYSLMKRIFENSAEPLYGRATSKFILHPFRTEVLKNILRDYNPRYTPDDLLTLYMITGGVAKYVELLMDAQCFTREKMLDAVFQQDSYFMTEGRDLLLSEFSGEYNVYFSIMQLIAFGLTRVSEIDSVLQKTSSVYLSNLERNYELISRAVPLMAKPGSKTSKYYIRDHFLRFWFRFVYPYQALIERGQTEILRQHADKAYEQFSGRTLEAYFQERYMETGLYTQIGNWWDRNGKNEIDLVALNEFDKTGIIAEIKRNPRKINLDLLREKAKALPPSTFGKYAFTYKALSLEDL